MTMRPLDLYQKLVDFYGRLNMILLAIEEMSELIKELVKYEREDYSEDNRKSIIEEIADVTIVIDELMWLFGIHDEVENAIEEKICRTMGRLKSEQTKKKLRSNEQEAL